MAIHVLLAGLSIGRVRLVVGVHVARSIFRHGLLSNVARGGSRILVGLVAYGRKLDRPSGISRGRRAIGSLGIAAAVLRDIGRCRPLSLLFSLALSLLLLLPLLPLFANLLKFFGSSLLAVRLHGDMRVEMVQSAVGLLASIPAALVHALDFLIASAGALVLLRAWDGHERVNLAGSLLRSRGWGLGIDWVAGSQRRSSMLAVPGPVGSGLRIHASAGMGVAMRHVWIRRIRRVLPIRVGWTRSRNRRIVLLLRHTSAARAAGRMV